MRKTISITTTLILVWKGRKTVAMGTLRIITEGTIIMEAILITTEAITTAIMEGMEEQTMETIITTTTMAGTPMQTITGTEAIITATTMARTPMEVTTTNTETLMEPLYKSGATHRLAMSMLQHWLISISI